MFLLARRLAWGRGSCRHPPGSIQSLYTERRHSQGSVADLLSGLHDGLVPGCRKRRGMSCSLWRGFLQKLSCLRKRIKDRRLSSKNNSGLESGAIYQLLKARGQPSDDRGTFVRCDAAPPHVQMFMWLLLRGRIQCRMVLHRKHVLPDAISEICKEDDESPEHIISGCPIGKQFWEKLGLTSMVGADVRNIHRTIPERGIPKEEFAAFVALSCW